MAKSKQYRVIDKVGVVGFKGVIHKTGDTIDSSQVPPANLKAWIRFGQVEEIAVAGDAVPGPEEKKGKK